MWQIILIVSIIFLILEIFVPAMFFLNLAIAGFITAGIALYTTNIEILVVSFVLLSMLCLFFFKSYWMKYGKNKITGVKDKYIGKIVKVIQPISKYSGAITIYDERWEARIEVDNKVNDGVNNGVNDGTDDEIIPVGAEVRIIRNESLIMYIERVK